MSALVYGTMDFACAHGVWDALRNRRRPWVPTNACGRRISSAVLNAEALFGMLLLAVPLLSDPAVLYLPCSYLFAGKFLFAPLVAILYDDERPRIILPSLVTSHPMRWLARTVGIAA